MDLIGKKIAILIQSLSTGGAERKTLNLVKGLLQEGIQVDLLVADRRGGFLAEVPPQARIIDLKGKKVFFSILPLIAYLRRESPDLLHSIQLHTSLVAIWAVCLTGKRIPLVISPTSMISTQIQQTRSIRERLVVLLMRTFSRRAEAAICVSQGVADDMIRMTRIPSGKVFVVYNPVDLSEIDRKSQAILTDPWFMRGEPPVILAVGRLALAKNFSTLLRAFAIVVQELPSRLLILGDGPERIPLESLAEELGITLNIRMPGFMENPYNYMKHARLLVVSSLWEGFPNVLVEALACGTPVVSTDCRSGPREILGEGHSGILVPVGDSEAMAGAILETLRVNPDRDKLMERARDFSLERSVANHLIIYSNCISARER